MSKQDKVSISDAKFGDILFKECNKSNSKGHTKSNFYEHLRTSYKIEKQRALRLHDLYYQEWQNLNDKSIDEQTIDNAKESLKIGLRTKLERMMHLQSMLEPDYRVQEVVGIANGKPIWVDRPLQPKEIQVIHAELSKMAGEYMPTKIAETDTSGNDKKIKSKIKLPDGTEIDL